VFPDNPELKSSALAFSYYDFSRYSDFLTGTTNNITGSGANGYYIDYIGFNTYPFQGESVVQGSTRADVIDYIEEPYQYRAILNDIISKIPSSRTGNLKIAVTEANISAEQDRTNKFASGIGPGSFLGGQFWAEMMAVSMEKEVEFISFWSVIEGSSGDNRLTDLGYISSETSQKRSTYHHYSMIANNFKGAFLPNLFSGNDNEHKAFAYKTTAGNEIGVIIMNQQQGSTDNTFSISFDNTAPTSGKDIGVKLAGGISGASKFDCRIPKETTYFLKFTVSGSTVTLIEHKEYGIEQAKANKPPKDISNGDMFITDGPGDLGTEINYLSGGAISDDIWSRPTLESLTGTYQYANEHVHVNPEYTTNPAEYPYLYVKVRNRGCKSVSGNVRMFYDDNNFGGSTWPTDWIEITGTAPSITLGPGEAGTVTHVWDVSTITTVPTSTVYKGYCIIAQFSSATESHDAPGSSSSYYDNTSTDILKYWPNNNENIMRFNNIAQRNINVYNDFFTGGQVSSFRPNSPGNIVHAINFTDQLGSSGITKTGVVTIDLGQDLYTKWTSGGNVGSGVTAKRGSCHYDQNGNCIHTHYSSGTNSIYTNPYEILITSPTAYISNISANSADTFDVKTRFQFKSSYNSTLDNVFDLTGRETSGNKWLSTMRYEIEALNCETISAEKDGDAAPECPATLTAYPEDPDATYQWFNYSTGILVDTGRIIQVAPTASTLYELEVVTLSGCIGYDTIRVEYARTCEDRHMVQNSATLQSAALCRLYPNPNNGNMTFEYNLTESQRGILIISDLTGRELSRYDLVAGSTVLKISNLGVENGSYLWSFLINGELTKSEKLMIIH
jgi:hypothetical protein